MVKTIQVLFDLLLLLFFDPVMFFLITVFFIYRYIYFRSLLFEFLSLKQTLIHEKFFPFVFGIVFLMTLISLCPLLLILYDINNYLLLCVLFLDVTFYSLNLENIVFFFIVCVFLFLLDKNSVFVKKEFKEFMIILKKYLYPYSYLQKKYKSSLTFVSKVLVPGILTQFISFKNTVKNYRNFFNYYFRKYKTWFKSKSKKR
jgi:hypothetical protein